MKRRIQRSLRKIEQKLIPNKWFTSSFGRSNSSYDYPRPSRVRPTPIAPANFSEDEEDDDDTVFRSASSSRSSIDEEQRSSIVMIPCEFCQAQQPSSNIRRHEASCSQNPNNNTHVRSSRRRHSGSGRRRRAVSDSLSPQPSAPPRSRSPSLTEDIPIPPNLVCPITAKIFHDPVVASDGHTYERTAITHWLQMGKTSPVTREPMSIEKLNTSLFVKNMVDDFRAECRRKRSIYKYKLNEDLKRTDETPVKITNTSKTYRGKWIKKPISSMPENIQLLHLTGEHAEKIANMYSRVEIHPHIIRTYGRVEHDGIGILLVQEYVTNETLSDLIENSPQILSVNMINIILGQIASALQYINECKVNYGRITTDDIIVSKFDINEPRHIMIKLTNIGDPEKLVINNETESQASSIDIFVEKSDIYTFGHFAKELYRLSLDMNAKCLAKGEVLMESCLLNNLNERPTFGELIETISKI